MKNNNNRSLLKMVKYEEEEEEVLPNAWSSDLPSDLLGLISVKLLHSMSLSEYVRFGSVCIGWRSFSIESYQHIKLPSKLPMLLIPLSSPPICCPPTTTDDTKKQTLSPPSLIEEEEEVEVEVEVDGEEQVVKVGLEKVQDDGEEVVKVGLEEVQEEEEEEEPDEGQANYYNLNYYNPRDIWEGQDYKQRFRNTRNLYNISENIVYHDFPLQIPYYKNIRGSSHGWLVTVEEDWTDNGVNHNRVQLFNPFRSDNNKIQLPPFPSLSTTGKNKLTNYTSSYYLHRTCLSANPSSLSSDLTQLVVLGVSLCSKVWFCRPGDKNWTHLKDMYEKIQDMLCYEGRLFYAILKSGYVFAFVIDVTQHHPKHIYRIGILPPQQDVLYPYKSYTLRYLVECNGNLLQIRREIMVNLGSYQTCQFIIFKLNGEQWDEIKTLNDYILFLGGSCTSMSLYALDFHGCKPNSIYYTDNFELYYISQQSMGPRDIGVFNVEDGSFERYYAMESKVIMPSPIWIQPML